MYQHVHIVKVYTDVIISTCRCILLLVCFVSIQIDSVFNLRRPYDLMALLRQEERAIVLENLKQELLTRKEDIDKNEDKETGILLCS